MTTNQVPEEVGRVVRAWLSVGTEEQTSWADHYQAFRQWRAVLDGQRILVLQLQLGTESIRGFSIWDDYAPILAANTAYNYAARIFTVFHELAHLISRTDSACSTFVSPSASGSTNLAIERWCEEVASACLLPESDFRRVVADGFGHTRADPVRDFETARRIAQRFKVSIRSVAVRLIRLDLADYQLYSTVEDNAEVSDRPRPGGGGGGLTAPRQRITQLGNTIPQLVVDAADRGDIPLRDAIDYLGLKLSDFDELSSLVRRGPVAG